MLLKLGFWAGPGIQAISIPIPASGPSLMLWRSIVDGCTREFTRSGGRGGA